MKLPMVLPQGVSASSPALGKKAHELTRIAAELGAKLAPTDDAVGRMGAELLAVVEQRRVTLLRLPLESEERLGALLASVADAERALERLSESLLADEREIILRFSKHRAEFFAGSAMKAQTELRAAMGGVGGRKYEWRRQAIEVAREIGGWYIADWQRRMLPILIELQREATRRLAIAVGQFADNLKQSEELAGITRPFEVRSKLLPWSELRRDDLVEPRTLLLVSLVDVLRSRDNGLHAIERAAGRYLAKLLQMNSAQIERQLGWRIAEIRSNFEREIRGRLGNASTSAMRACSRARALQRRGDEAVHAEIAWLDQCAERVRSLMGEADFSSDAAREPTEESRGI
jgi:hypothetical protein